MPRAKRTTKTVETLRHQDASRKNIPTAEYQAVMADDDRNPIKVAYERRNRDLDPQLVWRGKDEQDWADLVVQAPPLFIQEKVHPKVLIDDLRQRSGAASAQADLFADFNGLPSADAQTEFYQHDANWSNRMILGDSLQVMASLAEREGLRGKVQCIYIDPPYGIKFNSNFQWSTTSRDVRDGKAEHITREPEQVKAFRDTWRDGVHSYLTYLRDRLTVARDLLTESGSVFVQIGDENVHRVRAVMDEVFGEGNFISLITIRKTTSEGSNLLGSTTDFIIWYGKSAEKTKFRSIYQQRSENAENRYANAYFDGRKYRLDNVTSSRPAGSGDVTSFFWCGREFTPGAGTFKTTTEGLDRLTLADRLYASARGKLSYRRFQDDFTVSVIGNLWNDISGAVQSRSDPKIYVVQTSTQLIQRCILMTTDPGDLVLDPTCGSGTTAYVAEQWGRRWITIDTSRVALALARARIMGARYPFYLLADSRDGQIKEAALARKTPSEAPTYNDIRQGFVYERVPHITLKSIANNAEIDVIWEKFQETLEPLRRELNDALGTSYEEWEIPRDANDAWPEAVRKIHANWWDERIARQKEIDASIAAKADYEYLYDKPYEDNKKVRVAGPFTVESLSPHRLLGVDENDELIDNAAEAKLGYGEKQDFAAMILDHLKTAGVQQAHKEDRIAFSGIRPYPGSFVCAEGTYAEGNADSNADKRAGIFVGPEFGTVSRPDLVEAVREAADADFDVLVACAFNFDAHASEFNRLGRVPVLKARMNADLHMADDLKNTGQGNLFVIFGEPDITVVSGQWLVTKSGEKLANYEQVKELSGLGSLAEINRAGKDGLATLGAVSGRGKLTPADFPLALTTDHWSQVTVHGVDVFHPNTGEIRSDSTDDIACWFVDTDYNEESFFVRHAYFLGASDPYKALRTTLKAEINQAAWETLHSDTSRPFAKPGSGRIAVKVINHLGDEVMKVFRV